MDRPEVFKEVCPVCGSKEINTLLSLTAPVLQNRVYTDFADAVNSNIGVISLGLCENCGFGFNTTFDNRIIVYDQDYDNSVPSNIFRKYYENIADYLYNKYNLSGKTVYDIGCGKGTFLEILCRKYSDVCGVGIDPSYEGDLDREHNLRFIIDFFDAKYVNSKPDLILCRHVFEHIEYPSGFLKIIESALEDFEDVPFFFEVPDFGWIVNNNTFWDICYEHCNYFSPFALEILAETARSTTSSITPAFGNQYLWFEGLLNASKKSRENLKLRKLGSEVALKFAENYKFLQDSSRQRIIEERRNGAKIVVWGMATKGVIFCNLLDRDKFLIDYCIDLNEAKQEKFIPVSGHRISSPKVLSDLGKERLYIIVMNPNYLEEIKEEVSRLNLNGAYCDAQGKVL